MNEMIQNLFFLPGLEEGSGPVPRRDQGDRHGQDPQGERPPGEGQVQDPP